MTFKRGDIIRTVTKSGYMREGVIVSNSWNNVNNHFVNVAYFGRSNRDYPMHIPIKEENVVSLDGEFLFKNQVVRCETLTVLSKNNIEEKLGFITKDFKKQINKGIAIQLGLCEFHDCEEITEEYLKQYNMI